MSPYASYSEINEPKKQTPQWRGCYLLDKAITRILETHPPNDSQTVFYQNVPSIARVAAGAFGFLIFNHAFDGPDPAGLVGPWANVAIGM